MSFRNIPRELLVARRADILSRLSTWICFRSRSLDFRYWKRCGGCCLSRNNITNISERCISWNDPNWTKTLTAELLVEIGEVSTLVDGSTLDVDAVRVEEVVPWLVLVSDDVELSVTGGVEVVVLFIVEVTSTVADDDVSEFKDEVDEVSEATEDVDKTSVTIALVEDATVVVPGA